MHVLKPRLSEKAYATSQATNTFALDVPAELNKHEIAAAVEPGKTKIIVASADNDFAVRLDHDSIRQRGADFQRGDRAAGSE